MNKIEISGQILYIIVNIITFAGAALFIADNYLKSEDIKTILFGAMLLLVFVEYIVTVLKLEIK